jgi:hypothetical protein
MAFLGKISLLSVPIDPQRPPVHPPFPRGPEGKKEIYTRILTHPIHFDPQDGGRIYIRNVGNTAHMNAIQRLKTRFNVNREPLRISESLLI